MKICIHLYKYFHFINFVTSAVRSVRLLGDDV